SYTLTLLTKHDADEANDFRTRTVVVTSKDENLTKAHVRYLESRLVQTQAASVQNILLPESRPKHRGNDETPGSHLGGSRGQHPPAPPARPHTARPLNPASVAPTYPREEPHPEARPAMLSVVGPGQLGPPLDGFVPLAQTLWSWSTRSAASVKRSRPEVRTE